ncbi:Cytochrome [Forsythia ovata]|uniref:Cytochrome n=1 Tax=Forsythia ovata TaxID=205694 RepID=A0ABD1S255_9LAMI
MHLIKKIFPLSISSTAVLVLLFLVHFAQCSSDVHKKSGSLHNSSKHAKSQKTLDITLHGILLWASMGFLMPLGVLTIRMSSTEECHRTRRKILFYVHAILQVLSVLLATVGAVLSIRKFENAFDNSHQRIGLALYGAIYVQVLIGFRRPKRGTRNRSFWYLLHWILGTTICLVGIINVYTGLQAYHKRTSKGISLWSIIFTAQVSFMAIFYLFQDKWDYMKKQRMIPMNSPEQVSVNSRMDTEKDNFNEVCRKSNALGTHFLRSNALNKLFQLT